MIETIAGVRIPDSRIASEATELIRDTTTPLIYHHSRRVFLFGSLAITMARYRARPRIAIRGSAIPRYRAGTAVSRNRTAIRTRQRRRREVILDDERFLSRGG